MKCVQCEGEREREGGGCSVSLLIKFGRALAILFIFMI